MNKLKALAVILFSSLIFQQAYSCAWGPSDAPYIMFKAKYFVSEKYAPLFYSASPNLRTSELPYRIEDRNIDEWVKFFENKIDKDQLKEIIYRQSISEVQSSLDSKQINNKIEFLRYLKFAKEIEPLCESNIYSWEEKTVDKLAVNSRIAEAKMLYQSSDNEFLKFRYGYQILKLNRVVENYNAIKDMYEEELKDIRTKSIIKYWVMDQYAGALSNLGETVKAAYLFSKVFANSYERRFSAYQSFKIVDAQQWTKLLAMCKNDEEKLNLYFLRAIETNSRPTEEINEMLQINPNSELTKTLIIKEINKLESNIFPDAVRLSYLANPEIELNKSVKTYLEKMSSLIERCLKSNQTDFYKLCKTYLAVLGGEKNISCRSSQYPQAARLITQLSYLIGIDQIEQNDENYFFKSKKRFSERFDELCVDFFEYKYSQSKKETKAYLCNHYLFDLKKDLKESLVYGIEKINNKPNKSKFEIYCLNKFNSYSDQKLDLSDKLTEIKATLEFKKFNFTKAINLYSLLGREYQKKSKEFNIHTNPFNIAISDRIGYYSKKAKHTKLSIAKLMLKLENLSKEEKPNPQDCFLLANAYFNLSYYGRSWNVISYYRSTSSVSGFSDFTKAIELYKRALYFSNDREFQAKCAFMIAKCEQHQFILKYKTDKQGWFDYYLYDVKEFSKMEKEKNHKGYREYFRILKNRYSDTQYYQEAIKECGYLSNWVENRSY